MLVQGSTNLNDSNSSLLGHLTRLADRVQHFTLGLPPMILWGILRPKPHLRYRTGSETDQRI